jgi:purine-binding chemotaxis protein CheW
METTEKKSNQELFLTFKLGEQLYGTPVGRIAEIDTVMDVTFVPKMPPLVRGVMNLRGKVIPIVDLRIKFGKIVTSATKLSCIIVMETATGLVGGQVDSVSSVESLDSDSIELPVQFNDKQPNVSFIGIGTVKEGVVILVDLSLALAADQFHNALSFHEGDSVRLQGSGIQNQGHAPVT